MDRRRFLGTTTVASGLLASTTARASSGALQHLDVVRDMSLAWRRKDLDAVLAHAHDDIVWHSHVGSPSITGKAAMRDFVTRLTAQMQDIRWRIFGAAQHDDQLYLEGVDDYVTTEGRRVVLPYAGVMAFRDGLVVEWRDYFDRALFDRLKAGETPPAYLEALTSRPALF